VPWPSKNPDDYRRGERQTAWASRRVRRRWLFIGLVVTLAAGGLVASGHVISLVALLGIVALAMLGEMTAGEYQASRRRDIVRRHLGGPKPPDVTALAPYDETAWKHEAARRRQNDS